MKMNSRSTRAATGIVSLLMFLAIAISLIGMLSATSGCAKLQSAGGVNMATTFITLKVIDNSSNPDATAQRARNVVASAQKLLDGDASLTVADLEAHVRQQIDWSKYDPSEAFLIDALITAAREDLEDGIGPIEGIFDATRTARAREILTSINNAIILSGH